MLCSRLCVAGAAGTIGLIETHQNQKGHSTENARLEGGGIRVRAYFGERDHHGGKPLWSALLEVLRQNHAAGATVTRGIAGYGANSTIHAASIVDLSADLPLVLEWIDTEERVMALLPTIEGMLQGGLITTDPVTVIRYKAHD